MNTQDALLLGGAMYLLSQLFLKESTPYPIFSTPTKSIPTKTKTGTENGEEKISKKSVAKKPGTRVYANIPSYARIERNGEILEGEITPVVEYTKTGGKLYAEPTGRAYTPLSSGYMRKLHEIGYI